MPEKITPLLHVHALLMFLWVFVLIAQARFIRTTRFRHHQLVGQSSYVIAPLINICSLIILHGLFNYAPKDETLAQVFRLGHKPH